jgi:UDP-N-acetylglucosamine 2-epimerase
LKRLIPTIKKWFWSQGTCRENFAGFEQLVMDFIRFRTGGCYDSLSRTFNPNVKDIVYKKLSHTENIYLIPPASILFFCVVDATILLIVTAPRHSGRSSSLETCFGYLNGINRPEGVTVGFILVGTDQQKNQYHHLFFLDEFSDLDLPSIHGTGDASRKIVTYLLKHY